MKELRDAKGFRLVSVQRGDDKKFATYARFQCVVCAAEHNTLVKTGAPLNSELIAQHARNAGWDVNPWKANHCWCPACRARGGSAKATTIAQAIKGDPAPPPPEPPPTPSPEQEPTMAKPPTSPAPLAPLDAQQRQRIRALLDKHFDDSVGAYLDGMSDHALAEILNLPRLHIEQMREAAYGPLRISPEMQTLQRDLDRLRQDVAALRASIDSTARDLADDCTRALDRLAEMTRRVAAATGGAAP